MTELAAKSIIIHSFAARGMMSHYTISHYAIMMEAICAVAHMPHLCEPLVSLASDLGKLVSGIIFFQIIN